MTQTDVHRADVHRRAPGRCGSLALSTVVVAALVSTAFAAPPAAGSPPPRTATARPVGATPRPARPVPVPGQPDLGPNVYVFSPTMNQADIQATVDAIATQQVPNQFGPQRYALLFEPGVYGSVADPLTFQVGYYTEVAGLGRSPGDVTINGTIDVYNQCSPPVAPATSDCTALNNFWRSMSNLSINVTGQTGCAAGADFWATAQAAPMRRVQITGGNLSLMDYCSAGPQFASGGFIADSAFSGGTVINGSQQQFFVRNSDLDGWSNGVWNQVFAGDDGAPAQSFGVADANPYTTLPTNPVSREKPYLYVDSGGKWRVFVPALQRDSVGPTWTNGDTSGTSLPLGRFFVARPGTRLRVINRELAAGRDLLLTPGVYDLGHAIKVTRPRTVVLGLGFATLRPTRGHRSMRVSDVAGVKLSGLIFDAGRLSSRALLQVGGRPSRRHTSSADDPTMVQDVFFRIGGARPGRADNSLVVNSSHVILDDIWAWRADHGRGIGWHANVAATGLLVNGDDVTATGLFVEHFQKAEVRWNGQDGRVLFFQNEMPYDVPSQAAWMESASIKGYPALRVAEGVRTFRGYGMGSYSFFNQGIDIHATQAFQVPRASGIALTDILTRFLDGSGGIDSVVDGTGAPVTATEPGPVDVIGFP